jgi:hypothetical protein
MERPQIGRILVAQGAVSEAVLARALGYQRSTSQIFRLGSILLNWDVLAEDKLLAALAKLHHCAPVSWAELSQASREALQTFSAAFAMRLGAFPYALDGSGLRVAFRNPSDLAAVDEVSCISRKRLIPGVATEAALVLAYHRFYGRPVPPHFREVIQKFDRDRIAPTPDRQKGTRPVAVASTASGAGSVPRASSSSSVATTEKPAASETAGVISPSATDRPSNARAAAPPLAPRPEAPPPQTAPQEEPADSGIRARISVSVVDTVLAAFPRVLVFGVGRSAINGWTGRGPGLTPEIVASFRVPAAEETVVPEVARSGVPHFGALKPELLTFPLRGMLEKEAPACAVFPIRVFDTVAGVLYADRLGEPMLEEDYAVLSDAAETAANLLSKFLLPDSQKR